MIVARRLREWQLAVPELVERRAQVIQSRTPRTGYVTERTLGPERFARVVAALRD